eukprot:6455964-Amphidinium_carterae.1
MEFLQLSLLFCEGIRPPHLGSRARAPKGNAPSRCCHHRVLHDIGHALHTVLQDICGCMGAQCLVEMFSEELPVRLLECPATPSRSAVHLCSLLLADQCHSTVVTTSSRKYARGDVVLKAAPAEHVIRRGRAACDNSSVSSKGHVVEVVFILELSDQVAPCTDRCVVERVR